MKSGVYAIWRVGDDVQPEYVGSGVLHVRKQIHESCSSNKQLRALIAEFGASSFRWEVLQEAPADEVTLRSTEQIWMDDLKPRCNVAPVAGSNLGIPCPDNVKAAVAEANRQRVYTDAMRAKRSARQMGKKHSDQTKAKISAANKRRYAEMTPEEKSTLGHKGGLAATAEKLPDGRSVNAVKNAAARKKLPDGRLACSVKGTCAQYHKDRPKNADGLCDQCASS